MESTEVREQAPDQVEEPEAIPQESPEEKRWAKRDGRRPFKDLELPQTGEWVRVRRIGNMESARAGSLATLERFTDLLSKVQQHQLEQITKPESERVELDDATSKEFERERMTYLMVITHLSCVDRENEPDEDHLPKAEPCHECGWPHVPSLFPTFGEADLVDWRDQEAIRVIAERQDQLEEMAPFSQAIPDSASDEPADTGTSTPPSPSSAPTPLSA